MQNSDLLFKANKTVETALFVKRGLKVRSKLRMERIRGPKSQLKELKGAKSRALKRNKENSEIEKMRPEVTGLNPVLMTKSVTNAKFQAKASAWGIDRKEN